MRNPNGYGSITKLSGKRRSKYLVRANAEETWIENRVVWKRPTLGTFEKLADARDCLAKYNKQLKTNTMDYRNITFAKLFDLCKDKLCTSKSTTGSYRAAYKKLTPLYDMKMADIKTYHYQKILDDLSDLSDSSRNNIKIVISHVSKYAFENDIIEKDYSAFLSANNTGQVKIKRKLFTPDEIKSSYTGEICGDITIILLYTGLRINELLKMPLSWIKKDDKDKLYIDLSDSKTDAGKRIVPVHSSIVSIINKYISTSSGKYLIECKSGKALQYDKYNAYLKDIDHTPHDTRHTFCTKADKVGISKANRKRLMGHSLKDDITENVYTHKTIEELREEIEKITY